MSAALDRMPCIGTYRGVGIHAFQPAERIETIVKPGIDAVAAIVNADSLMAYVEDRSHPPEARLFAAARIEALWQLAADNRELRPKVSLSLLHAYTAGLDSLNWASSDYYGTLLEPGPPPGAPRRETRVEQCAHDLRAAQAALQAREARRRVHVAIE